MLLALRVPADNVRGPLYFEQALAAIHQANRRGGPLTLVLGTYAGTVGLFVRCATALRPMVERQLFAHYPDGAIDRIDEDAFAAPDGCATWTAPIDLKPDVFPIRRYAQFEDALNRALADPIAGVLAALSGSRPGELVSRLELTLLPAQRRRIARARRCVARLNRPFFRGHPRLATFYTRAATARGLAFRLVAWVLARLVPRAPASAHDVLTLSPSRAHEREDDLQAASDKLGRPLFVAEGRIIIHAARNARDQVRAKTDELAGSLGQFTAARLGALHVRRPRRQRVGRVWRPRSFLFTAEEVSTLVHPPVRGANTADAASVDARELPAPVGLPTPRTHADLAILGTTSFRGRSAPFGIAPEDRLRHMVIFGKTGTGKSTLLRNLLATDIAAGRGVTFVDPHGDTVDELLGLIPTSRTNDVIYVDPGDPHGVPSLNLLACAQPRLKTLVASAVLTAFKKLYADSWGPRLEHLLRNALLLLLDVPGATLANVLDLLSDDRYRRHALLHATDPIVRGFWEREFGGMPPKLRAEASSPVQNKIGHFVTNPMLRRIVAEPRSTLDLRRVLDDRKVLLVSLSKGRIGEDASTLLGSLVVTALQIAAQSRADMPEAKRRDHFAYVDEFHSFATDSFASILSEARKYRLSLTLATQYVEQIDDAVRAAILGNAGSLVSFQVGPQDADLLARQLGPEVTSQDLLRLPRYRALARLLLAGVPSRPFTMRTLAPLPPSWACQQPDVVRRRSRHQYAAQVIRAGNVSSPHAGVPTSVAHTRTRITQ